MMQLIDPEIREATRGMIIDHDYRIRTLGPWEGQLAFLPWLWDAVESGELGKQIDDDDWDEPGYVVEVDDIMRQYLGPMLPLVITKSIVKYAHHYIILFKKNGVRQYTREGSACAKYTKESDNDGY